jgi:hypothetical protein
MGSGSSFSLKRLPTRPVYKHYVLYFPPFDLTDHLETREQTLQRQAVADARDECVVLVVDCSCRSERGTTRRCKRGRVVQNHEALLGGVNRAATAAGRPCRADLSQPPQIIQTSRSILPPDPSRQTQTKKTGNKRSMLNLSTET